MIDDILQGMIGTRLSIVTFVEDYIQLHFDDWLVSILSRVVLMDQGREIAQETRLEIINEVLKK